MDLFLNPHHRGSGNSTEEERERRAEWKGRVESSEMPASGHGMANAIMNLPQLDLPAQDKARQNPDRDGVDGLHAPRKSY